MNYQKAPRPARRLRAALLASTMGVLLAIGPSLSYAEQTQGTQAPQNAVQQPLMPSLAPIVKKVMPAVVNISVQLKDNSDQGFQSGPDGMPFPGFPESPFDEFLKRFFNQQGLGGQAMPRHPRAHRVALGSGFIIDPKGYIVTNNHVVGDAEKVTVIFQDGSKHKAQIIGRDEKTDLALLKIDTDKPLPYVEWGDSEKAQVGDWIIAVGNPFGLGGTVTTGVISARGRNIHEGPFDDFLQLDAAINRGNSGGPTFNMQGQVIGINTAIYSPNGGSVGIGFAIPSNMAKNVIAQIRDHGEVQRGWLGVQIQGITPDIAKSLGLNSNEPKGALVASVQPHSPAAKAGIEQGDVIVKFDGKEVDKMHDLPRLVANAGPNAQVHLTVLRNGEKKTLTAKLGELKGHEQVASRGDHNHRGKTEPGKASAVGLELGSLTDSLRHRLDLGDNVKGVVVTDVSNDSPAASVLRPGDVIVSIDQKPVTNPHQAANALEEAKKKDRVALLLLYRNGINEYVGLPLAGESQG